jgi:hypothetical protein
MILIATLGSDAQLVQYGLIQSVHTHCQGKPATALETHVQSCCLSPTPYWKGHACIACGRAKKPRGKPRDLCSLNWYSWSLPPPLQPIPQLPDLYDCRT